MAEAGEESYSARLPDGSEANYVIRGLQNESEIKPWSEFCATVFSYKANPPPSSYFERHFTSDPDRGQPSLIRVAFHNGAMVASCRLFLRTISGAAGGTLLAGGIGEVCTLQNHRRRGLSKVLLENCIDIMKERKLQVSLLHAAPEFFSVYEKTGGYKCSKSCLSVVNMTVLPDFSASVDNTAYSIREATFPQDTARLSDLHSKYSLQSFVGCIVRSSEYWNQYLSQELNKKLWVLEQEGTIVAWLSLRPRGDRIQLQEFGTDSSLISTAQALDLLLFHAAQQMSAGNQQQLLLPTVVLDQAETGKDQFLRFMDWSSQVSENDLGWMYRVFDTALSFESISGEKQPHLIWPSDSF